jgi:transcriptional regulator with XRE-family HTH domain
MSPERRRQNEDAAEEMLKDLALQELRRAANLTQEQVADLLRIKQASVSKLEKQGDMYLSTLQRYVRALGGELKVVASFPGREIVLNRFGPPPRSDQGQKR